MIVHQILHKMLIGILGHNNCPLNLNCKNIKNVKDPVSKCPICGKDVFERKSKYGKIFYGCSGYPKCNFASWDKPTNLKCPKCKQYITVKETKTTLTYKCSNKDCDFTKQEEKPKQMSRVDKFNKRFAASKK